MQITIIPNNKENPPVAFASKFRKHCREFLEEWEDQLDGELRYFVYENGQDVTNEFDSYIQQRLDAIAAMEDNGENEGDFRQEMAMGC